MRACEHCGKPIAANTRRNKKWCSNNCSALASYYRHKAGIPPPAPWQHPALTSDDLVLRAAAVQARELGELHGWSPSTIRCTIDGLAVLLHGLPPGGRIRLSDVRQRKPRSTSTPRVVEVLTALDLFDDDTASTTRAWIQHSVGRLPEGFAGDVRAWLLVMLDGDARTKARAETSLRVYFSFVAPAIRQWSVTCDSLREITASDVTAALAPLNGWRRRTATAALRSLFFFAKKNKLVFTNPTTRLKAEPVNDGLVPMSEQQIRAVENTAVSAGQRLAVVLAAIHAAKPGAIRALMLNDLDLANRRITIAGNEQRLSELARRALLAWLDERRSRWPHTPNRHVLINKQTALADGPVSSHYLHGHLLPGISLDRVRRDRILHEALTAGPDPLHLALVFHISHTTASRYTAIAQRILDEDV
jgi:integrase